VSRAITEGVRHAVLVLALVACGNPARTGTSGPVPSGAGSGAVPVTGTSGGGDASEAGPLAARDVGVPVTTCVFHPGTATYFTCTNSAAGSCFHFGPACAPADGCMFDPTDRTYKQCAQASEGRCERWGSACAPETRCMFDPRDGYHRTCEEPAGGACRRFGALCAP